MAHHGSIDMLIIMATTVAFEWIMLFAIMK